MLSRDWALHAGVALICVPVLCHCQVWGPVIGASSALPSITDLIALVA